MAERKRCKRLNWCNNEDFSFSLAIFTVCPLSGGRVSNIAHQMQWTVSRFNLSSSSRKISQANSHRIQINFWYSTSPWWNKCIATFPSRDGRNGIRPYCASQYKTESSALKLQLNELIHLIPNNIYDYLKRDYCDFLHNNDLFSKPGN